MSPGMPSEELKTRLLRAVQATPAPTREVESRRGAMLIGGALLVSLLAFLAYGGVRMAERPIALVAGTVAGTGIIAALTLLVAVGRGRAMASRMTPWLTAAVLASPAALLGWKVFWSAQFEHGLDRWPSRMGFRCLGVSLSLGILPLAAFLFSRRGTDAVHPGLAGLGIGVGLGLAAATLVDTWCPVAYVPHFLIGHLLPLALLGAAGLWLGKKLLSP